MSSNNFQVIGANEIAAVLSEFAPRIANNLAKATIHGIAGEISKRAKKNVPVRTGNLKRSIKPKRRRGKPGQPVSDVIAEQGKSAKHDGFYWRFVEHGTKDLPERPFLRPAAQEVRANLPKIMEKQFESKLRATIKREMKKRSRL